MVAKPQIQSKAKPQAKPQAKKTKANTNTKKTKPKTNEEFANGSELDPKEGPITKPKF